MPVVRTDVPTSPFSYRIATLNDVPALSALVTAAVETNLREFLSPEQVAASHKVMAIDPALIEDGTYFVIEHDGQIAGCGGWSQRASLYTSHEAEAGTAQFVDPSSEPAKIRAMYTHPAFTRRGVGRMLLGISERAAASRGFSRLELMATMSGQPLYVAYGFEPIEPAVDTSTGVPIPLMRMGKAVDRAA